MLALLVLPLTFVVTERTDNINWVYGLGGPQTVLPPLAYLCLFFVALVVLIYLPSHLLFRHFFSQQKITGVWQGSNVAKRDNTCNETGRLQPDIGDDDE